MEAAQRRPGGRAIVAIALVVSLVGRAAADAPPTREVVELYERSTAAYQAGRFDEAATLLREIYRRRPDPTLLYNLGRALEGSGDLRGAIDAYRRYLDSAPRIPDRPSIEQRIQTLSRQLDEKEALVREREALRRRDAAAALVVAAPPPPRRPVYQRWWLWTTVVGVTLAGVAVGVGVWRAQVAAAAPSQPTDFGTRPFP